MSIESKRFHRRLAPFALVIVGFAGSTPGTSTTESDREFDYVLAGLARASDRYLDEALSFTAEETTRVLSYPFNSRKPVIYRSPVNIYFYQKTTSGRLIDRRVKREEMRRLERQLEQSKDAAEIVTDLNDPMHSRQIPFYIARPYGWIVIFSSGAQIRYRYEFERLTGRKVRIRFRPGKQPFQKEDWFGSAIVDLETLHILSAEGVQLEDYQAERRMKEVFDSEDELPDGTVDRVFVVKHISTEFSLVKNGLRLPTRVHSKIYRYILRETANKRKIREHLETEVIQKFENYKFYAVRAGTAVKTDSTPQLVDHDERAGVKFAHGCTPRQPESGTTANLFRSFHISASRTST